MLIESYVVGFSEVKRCISSLRPNDFVVVSENIFILREKTSHIPQDLLTASTPENHPEALIIINKQNIRHRKSQINLRKNAGQMITTLRPTPIHVTSYLQTITEGLVFGL
jgi:hypothetical protein